VEKAKKCHGDKFDYSLVDYKGINSKVKIICPINGHGVFEQTPTNHTHKTAPRGCPKCRRVIVTKALTKSEEEADTALFAKFGNKIKIKSDFKRFVLPCVMTCSVHGDFTKTVTATLGTKFGCTECAEEEIGRSMTKPKSQEQFIKDAENKHGDKYDYSLVNYVNSITKVDIYCSKHKNTFSMRPGNHLNGERCIECAREQTAEKLTGWYNPTIVERNKVKLTAERNNLYLMSITDGDESFYKIGIAKDPSNRVGHIRKEAGYKPKVLMKVKSSTYNCFQKEQVLHRMFKASRYKPKNKFKGHTECFSLNDNDLLFLEEVFLAI
jgi:hypothetical protein